MVTRALLEGSLRGVGKFGRTSIFPCGIFQFSKDINGYPGTPNYDLFKLAIKSTVKRLYPNYANVDWSVNKAAIEYDRMIKTEILERLDETQKAYLKAFFKDNPDIAKLLRVKIEDDKVVPVPEAYPDEVMGTINKPVA